MYPYSDELVTSFNKLSGWIVITILHGWFLVSILATFLAVRTAPPNPNTLFHIRGLSKKFVDCFLNVTSRCQNRIEIGRMLVLCLLGAQTYSKI